MDLERVACYTQNPCTWLATLQLLFTHASIKHFAYELDIGQNVSANCKECCTTFQSNATATTLTSYNSKTATNQGWCLLN